MGTFKLGKFKVKFDPETRGISYKWGDGEVRRLGGRKEPEYEEDYAAEYDDGYEESEGAYYDDQADDGYAGGYYAEDDGYDDGYQDGEYPDDGYQDEYQDGYDEEYPEGEAYPEEEGNPILAYIDNNPWLMYVLLVVLPPLGVWLLWRSGFFEQTLRIAISAASLIWFVIVLVLIISSLAGGAGDAVDSGTYVLTTPAPQVTAAPTATASAPAAPTATPGSIDLSGAGTGTSSGGSGTATGVTPTSTPLAAGSSQSSAYVYATTSGRFYHSSETCQLLEGATPSKVTVAVCKSRGQYECPRCYGHDVVYANPGGSYYHTKSACGDMKTSEIYTVEAAQAEGKVACSDCAGGKSTQSYADTVTVDKSGITVYCTQGGKYFHVYSDCTNMRNASAVTLLTALKAGKGACPECCAQAGTKVYCTEGGRYYHSYATCTSMRNASSVTLAAALVLGKDACPECITQTGGGSTSGVTVYATQGGQYYHTNSTCGGMKNAVQVSLASMISAGRPACPTCCSGADTVVYAMEGGTYYHSYATCSGMKAATPGTLARALAYGYKKCDKCWGGTTEEQEEETGGSGVYVYATQNGTYFHTNDSCSGMENAARILLETALSAGKDNCPTCCPMGDRTVYAVNGGKYYHATQECAGSGAKSGSLAKALAAGFTACPECIKGDGDSDDTQDESQDYNEKKFTVGTSGIKVYALENGQYYHTESTCAGSEASQVTLETALNHGMTGCPKCASDSNRKVYATSGGKYYHKDRTCAGDGATGGTIAEALAYGFDACPDCVLEKEEEETKVTYKDGTSGIRIYAIRGGSYFHSDKVCAGSEAEQISLETALNAGITEGCSECSAGANEPVYAVKGGKYYHYSKSCAGDGAVKGTLAMALGLGLDACPVCCVSDDGGSDDGDSSGSGESTGGSASGSTKVYVDLDSTSNIYHRSGCVSGADAVMLEFALEWDYSACSECDPPTSIE